MDPPPPKWKGQVLPPLPGVAVPGNLLLLISRPNEDDRTLDVNPGISNEMSIAENPLWLLPQDSALSARRLVNALNLIREGDTEKT
jgi:hypothetical protein